MRLEMTNNKISGTCCGCDLPDDICSEETERCVLYNGPIIPDHSSKNYREHGKIQQESEKETTP